MIAMLALLSASLWQMATGVSCSINCSASEAAMMAGSGTQSKAWEGITHVSRVRSQGIASLADINVTMISMPLTLHLGR